MTHTFSTRASSILWLLSINSIGLNQVEIAVQVPSDYLINVGDKAHIDFEKIQLDTTVSEISERRLSKGIWINHINPSFVKMIVTK
jgi:hypothetical protein